ncbi:unnamed protein product [Ambrosiozyma monospora]|uniref:Unnamed protein product n=1 Tax=Ambrosiozyma monospora TaxID=43982 RepID=A0A9W6Z3G4_AMBMO|nr:unnamed protein product [Ambrosiozyma monospora]
MVEIEEIPDEHKQDENFDKLISEWERRKYVPKEGEPALPPQLSELANKSTAEVLEELNRLPLFMTELDETDGDGGSNMQVEALKALAYEGEPHEVATNFKNQGNDCYKARQYKDAIEFYTKGLDVCCGQEDINAALYLNRCACNLELKNYRRCIDDAKECLKIQPKNIKALFRSAKAFFAVERYEEAEQILSFAKAIDEKNAAVNSLIKTIEDKKRKIKEREERKRKEEEERQRVQTTLNQALQMRGFTNIETNNPAELLKDSKIHLEDSHDIESQLIFPATVMYPTTDEFDFVAEISELTTPHELMEQVLQRQDSFFEDPKHKDFTPKKLQAFMETSTGGLIKVGKKVALNEALMSKKPKAPLFDHSLRIYFVPKDDVSGWISTWSKEKALSARKGN